MRIEYENRRQGQATIGGYGVEARSRVGKQDALLLKTSIAIHKEIRGGNMKSDTKEDNLTLEQA